MRIEFVLLANHVETVQGLLYISGGGWTDTRRPIAPGAPPPPTHMGVALSVAIPWHETNQVHTVTIQIENDDATVTVANIVAQINVGRPPDLPPGADQHMMMGLPMDLIFPEPGGYRVVARLDESEETKTWAFRVHDMPMPNAPLPNLPLN